MILMNSLLTMEERTLLQSLGCKDKAQAIEALKELKISAHVRSDLFAVSLSLMDKLEREKIDFAFEMAGDIPGEEAIG